MGSSLRARLAAMNAGKEKKAAPQRGGLKVIYQEHPLPQGLEAPDERALERMGLDCVWPGLHNALFLDCETTGLAGGAGTIAFMITVAWAQGSRLALEQYTLGDYGDEPEMLEKLARRMEEHPLAVTFNGRTFDIPLLRGRFVMMRMAHRWTEPMQLDLLPPARKLWRKRLGSVKLSVLEEKVLRLGREEDLPGSEAPARFFQYLKTGDRELLEPVALHNRLDVLALPRLLARLMESYALPREDQPPQDLFSLGRTLEKRGERDEAIRCYHMASLPRPVTSAAGLRQRRVAGEAKYALGMLYKRLGRYHRAAAAFEQAADQGGMDLLPLVELAKLFEHRLKDYRQALCWCRRAQAIAGKKEDKEALNKREKRLLIKLHRGGDHHGI